METKKQDETTIERSRLIDTYRELEQRIDEILRKRELREQDAE